MSTTPCDASGERILCLHLPQWPLQRLCQEQPELRQQPMVLYGKSGRQARSVWACNELARQQGIRLGMPLLEAKRQFSGCVQAIDPVGDEAALERLAIQCQRFTPYCGLRPANPHRPLLDTLLLDIGKTNKFFGGEAGVLQQIADFFQSLGYEVRGVVADHWAAAWALAVYADLDALAEATASATPQDGCHSTARNLGSATSVHLVAIAPASQEAAIGQLPVAALRVDEDTCQKFADLGIERIEQVWQLPADSLPARFGSELNWRLAEMAGASKEKIQICSAETTFHSWRNLEYPTTDVEVLQHHVQDLLGELLPRIAALQSGVLSLECQWFVAQRPPLHFALRLVQPIQDSEYLQSLLQLQWERVQLPAEVTAVHLLIPLIAADKPQQQWLFADSADTRLRHRATLLDRLASRLGPEQVLQKRWVPQALPERGFVPRAQVRRQTATKPRERQTITQPHGLLERPTRLYHPARPLANPTAETFQLPGTQSWVPAVLSQGGNKQRVQHAVGPERIESQWWEGRWERRDYYRVQTETGERFWIYQEIGTARWWLQGEFA